MFHKGHRWYADWEEGRGNRKRKAFSTRKAALKYQTEKRNRWKAEQIARPTPPPKPSLAPGRKQRRTTSKSATRRARSSPRSTKARARRT